MVDFPALSGVMEGIRRIAHVHARVAVAARKYRIDSLESLACQNFSAWAEWHWQSSSFILVAKDIIYSQIAGISTLQNIILDTMLRKFHVSVQKAQFQELLKRYGSLGSVFITKIIEHYRARSRHTAPAGGEKSFATTAAGKTELLSSMSALLRGYQC
ncbi:uncharacterized protein N7503_006548 [Penicillium pulvis]|uniref:uncharacterized protein n=1 Tax=Penicillium pulvis TaxID=1562058 RepID=UPI002546E1B4|nr:uncharacterized protein N7503_006548 [Penicillium pulvis]KAJ5799043.1 hypothetical protein N7503_006548 [Penicillium pulvis]